MKTNEFEGLTIEELNRLPMTKQRFRWHLSKLDPDRILDVAAEQYELLELIRKDYNDYKPPTVPVA